MISSPKIRSISPNSSLINKLNKSEILSRKAEGISFKGFYNLNAQNVQPVTPNFAINAIQPLNYADYQQALNATKTLNANYYRNPAEKLNKAMLYKAARNQSDVHSNPVIQLLIEDNQTVQDNKQLADAIPRSPVASWKADPRFMQYAQRAQAERSYAGQISSGTANEMLALVKQYYVLPDNTVDEQKKINLQRTPVHYDNLRGRVPESYIRAANHIVDNWKNLVRQTPQTTSSSLIPLPKPYVIPGGRFRECYYWDSYFTILGLKNSGLNKLALDMVDNFKYLVKQFGFIPNGNRTYYLSRSQPPFLAMMADEVAPKDMSVPQNRAWLQDTYDVVKHEYFNNWMDKDTHYVSQFGLNRYFDAMDVKRPESWGSDNINTANTPEFYQHERSECESGWDFSNRFDKRCADHIPVDLNALLYKYETIMSKWANQLDRPQEAKYWAEAADTRKLNMNKWLWNEEKGMYFDFDVKMNTQSDYESIATAYPMWAGMVAPEKAMRIRSNLVTKFEQAGGFVTALDTQNQNFQWNYPNGWPSHQWIAIEALKNYDFNNDAKRVATKWLDLNTRVFEQTGRFVEKYNVVQNSIDTTGTYPLQDGFGWTNGVYLQLLNEVMAK